MPKDYYATHQIVLVGDSDIAFWPEDLLPSVASDAGIFEKRQVSGHPGASLADTLPNLRKTLEKSKNSISRKTKKRIMTKFDWEDDRREVEEHDLLEKINKLTEHDDPEFRKASLPPLLARLKHIDEGSLLLMPKRYSVPNTLFVVFCAGENDIGEGLSLDNSVHALWQLLDVVFDDQYRPFLAETTGRTKVVLIFLGPKFEPWLDDDPASKQEYLTLSRAFERRIKEYQKELRSNESKDKAHFIDCLTMFCGESADVPGARIGGRASAEEQYFAADRLHLSRLGYQVWKDEVETIIRQELHHGR